MNRNAKVELSSPKITRILAEKIRETAGKIKRNVTLMEVCGTHTVAIFRSGIKSILPGNVRLISGPGCPVCVTPNNYLDRAIALSRLDETIVCTFGDMMKVPGSSSSLEKEKTRGKNIRIVYSTLDALKIAKENPDKEIIFLGIGFETTAPTVAVSLKEAKRKKIRNFYVLSAHKLVPPALRFLAESKDLRVDGFICPGHVSTIIGTKPYDFLVREFGIPCVVSGFEPLDLFESLCILLIQIEKKKPEISNQYVRAVKTNGNPKASELMNEVFENEDSTWRGIGTIPLSGLKIRDDYEEFDAFEQINVEVEKSREPKGCLCGLVIQGKKTPLDCPLFAVKCNPQSPIGPCMVSSEG
ncbi:MAG TPA: hydrogenase formation protein HypD, partial [Terriglobales bacterium]|nr:hydrogenase formation protein HypD [Terriglobales bacterium]